MAEDLLHGKDAGIPCLHLSWLSKRNLIDATAGSRESMLSTMTTMTNINSSMPENSHHRMGGVIVRGGSKLKVLQKLG